MPQLENPPAASGTSASHLRAPVLLSEFLHLRMTGRDPNKPKLDKVRTAQLIAETGLRGPETYRVFQRAEDIDLDALPEVFVLKPTELNGKRGVMLLHRIASGLGYWDNMQMRRLTAKEIIAEQRGWAKLYAQKRRRDLQFIAEELVVGENGLGQIPFDYKVYTFDGVPRFILQLDRNIEPMGAAFFDGEFRPMAESDSRVTSRSKTQRTAPVVPACAQDVLATASALSRALRTPFISIDCYATARGALVGEITIAPGGPYTRGAFSFSRAFDRELGTAWVEAAGRLGEPVPLYDDSWSEEKRRVSGLPLTLE